METPASLSNSAAAATIIQRAFRIAQKRIASDQADLAAILNSLEEAEEHFGAALCENKLAGARDIRCHELVEQERDGPSTVRAR